MFWMGYYWRHPPVETVTTIQAMNKLFSLAFSTPHAKQGPMKIVDVCRYQEPPKKIYLRKWISVVSTYGIRFVRAVISIVRSKLWTAGIVLLITYVGLVYVALNWMWSLIGSIRYCYPEPRGTSSGIEPRAQPMEGHTQRRACLDHSPRVACPKVDVSSTRGQMCPKLSPMGGRARGQAIDMPQAVGDWTLLPVSSTVIPSLNPRMDPLRIEVEALPNRHGFEYLEHWFDQFLAQPCVGIWYGQR